MHIRFSTPTRKRVLALSVAAATSVATMLSLGTPLPADAALQAAPPRKAAANDTNDVVVSTSAELQAAISSAKPGTTILLQAGTYTGPFYPSVSGTAEAPIVMRPAGKVPVTLTANLPMPACDASGPDLNRTIRFKQGASYWTIRGMTIKGGVYIAGMGVQDVHNWMENYILDGNWQALRDVPGRGTDDPEAAHNAVSYVANKLNETLTPVDGVQIINDTITQKGIHVALARYGRIVNTSISDVACGVGPGIWLGSYSDGWKIVNDTVSNVTPSTHSHYMQEGIRIDDGSNYNRIAGDTVSDLPGDGRAFTTDQTGSYNEFVNDTASNVAIGFNDEMAGWGNLWADDTVTDYRTAGFAYRLEDYPLSQPSMATSTVDAVIRCDVATGSEPGLKIGATAQTSVEGNNFSSIALSSHLRDYWSSQGNTYNGTSEVPPTDPAPAIRSDC